MSNYTEILKLCNNIKFLFLFQGSNTKFQAYVKNIAWRATEAELLAHFSDCHATKAEIKLQTDQTSRGFGFVEFTNQNDLTLAIAVLNLNLLTLYVLFFSWMNSENSP